MHQYKSSAVFEESIITEWRHGEVEGYKTSPVTPIIFNLITIVCKYPPTIHFHHGSFL